MFENLLTFANQIRIGMETITLSFDPNSEFAAALDELIRNSEGVRVVKRRKTKETEKRGALYEAIQEEKEGKLHTYANVDELFAELGI